MNISTNKGKSSMNLASENEKIEQAKKIKTLAFLKSSILNLIPFVVQTPVHPLLVQCRKKKWLKSPDL